MPRLIEPQIRPAFIERAVRSNWTLMRMVSVFAIAVELFNMGRVLFGTEARLGTLNNRIYFGFYASLFLAGAAFLVIDVLLRERLSLRARYRMVLTAGSVFVLWQVLFAIHDISRSISIGKISAVTSLVAFAALFLMEPLYAVANIAGCYAILLTFLSTLGDGGAVLNYLIVAALSLVIYFARLHDVCTELTQAGIIQDMHRQKRIAELEKELRMDNFTRTLNKTALASYAARRLAELPPDEELAMLILDMDDFKVINDTYGHLAGDSVLVQLAGLMNELAPDRARVGRLGGDEFAVVFNPPDAEAAACAYARQLLEAVPRITWNGETVPAACSIGIAVCGRGTDYAVLYDAADKALYQAKHEGKGRYCLAADAPA